MNNLNKENYFDELTKKYPATMSIFCDWIDQYKDRIGWKKLFNDDSDYQSSSGRNAKAPKFHDLPYEMQYGIMLRFFSEKGIMQVPSPSEITKVFELYFSTMENGIGWASSVDAHNSPGANAIFLERIKQIGHGFDVDQDKANEKGELVDVAITLLTGNMVHYPNWWEKDKIEKYLRRSSKEKLALAGGFIAAEYDRLVEEEKLVLDESK